MEGGGGNSGVIVGDKGVIVIDAKTTPAGGKELLDNIAKITPKPVTIILTTATAITSMGWHRSQPASRSLPMRAIRRSRRLLWPAGGRGAPPADHLPTQVVTNE